jgi:hemerythrin superfamily protein
VAEIGRRLRDHVRLEEDVVFPRIEQVLDEAQLQELRRRLPIE